MNRDQIICPCLDITAGQIMDAYKEGAKSVEAIKEVTGQEQLAELAWMKLKN